MELEETLVSAVNSYVSSGATDSIAVCVTKLEVGHVKLVNFVSVLGNALTSNVVAERRRGIQLLTEVVTALPLNFFNDAEVTLLLEFFCARLSDHHSIVPVCLAGIAKLLRAGTLGHEDVIRVIRLIFSDVTVQTLIQSDRMLVYGIFEQLITERLSIVREITAEFVCGIVQALDSEKDPRNLLMCLKLVELVAKEFTLEGNLAEDVFEVVACYYPIDYSPPAGPSNPITKGQLSSALLNAMTANPLFGEFCLPLVLEKLSSSVTEAKTASLQMLIRSCNVFYRKDISVHFVELWNCIKSDVFAQYAAIEDEALHALTALVRCLSDADSDSSPEECSKFINIIFGDCGKYLYEPEQRVCQQAGKLLHATCNASSTVCHLVMQLAMPVVIAEFHRHTHSVSRQTLLDVLQGLLLAATSVSVSGASKSPMAEYKESIIDIYVSLVVHTDATLRCRAITGIASLLTMPFVLETHESNLLLQHMVNLLLTDAESMVVEESIASAVLVASKQPAVVCQTFLPVLTRILTGSEEEVKLGQHVNTIFVVKLISSISTHSTIAHQTIPILFRHMSDVVQSNNYTVEDFHQCCVCLMSVVTMMSNECCSYFVNWLAPRCVALALHICTVSLHILCPHQLVTELAAVVHTIVQQSRETDVNTFVSSVLSTFLHGDVVKYCEHTDLGVGNFVPLSCNFPGEQVCCIPVLTSVVCSSSFNCIALPLMDELMSRLAALIGQFSDESVYVCVCKCLSGLINRRQSDAFLDATLESVKALLVGEIYDLEIGRTSQKCKALTLCVWTTKALVMRNHMEQMTFLKFLIDCLADVELAALASDGFKLILSDDKELTDDIFTSASGATRTIMYKQRFFTMSMPLLLTEYQNVSTDVKRFYVTALSHLMQFVPKQVLVPELPRLLPVLLQSLNVEEPDIWVTTLDTLTELLSDNSELLQSYVDDMLPRLLSLSTYRPLMKVRIAAVCCIAELSTLPVHLIMPHQQKVLHQLGSVIDDHKRLVRQEAASARSRWFVIGSSV